MPELKSTKRILVSALLVGGWLVSPLVAQESDSNRKTTEPVFRVSKRVPETTEETADASAPATGPAAATAPHPLDRALQTAYDGLEHIQNDIFDYEAIMVKRERINGKLMEREYMQVKIRNERERNGQKVPFSVYMKFVKPRGVAGREVIWIKGQNDNKLIAHEGGMMNLKTVHLDPEGWLAMRNNRYPIYEAGIENLVAKLIEKAERDRAAGDCEVEYKTGAKINGRMCSVIEVVHPDRRAPYDFHKAQVFIDDELQIPIRYAAYDWPTSAGAEPELMEEYTYVKVELNVGLTDADFSPENPGYEYR